MKLKLNENIRKYRRAADLTQAQLAEKLGVSDQAVSRWENGSTYPDIELLPVLAGTFGCTIDELIANADEERIKQYWKEIHDIDRTAYLDEACDLLRRAFAEFPNEYNFGIQLCYCLTDKADRGDEKVTDELRKVATDILNRCTDSFIRTDVIEIFSQAETEEHIDELLERYVPSHDISRAHILHSRYKVRGENDAYNIITNLNNIHAINHITYADFDPTPPSAQKDPAASLPSLRAKLDFLNAVSGIDEKIYRARPVYADGIPDAWTDERIRCGLRISCRLATLGKTDEALDILEDATELFEKFYGSVEVGTVLSYRVDKTHISDIVVYSIDEFEGWKNVFAHSPEENKAAYKAIHMPHIETDLYSGNHYAALANRDGWEWFDPIREHPRYIACMERMKKAGYIGK